VNYYDEGDYGSWVLLELCALPVKLSYTGKSIYKKELRKGEVHNINFAEYSN